MALGPGCNGCFKHDLASERKVLAKIESDKGLPIEIAAQKYGQHLGACTATGGGRGGFAIMPFDRWSYTIQIDAVRKDKKPTVFRGGGSPTLYQFDAASEQKEDPLRALSVQHCEDEKSGRIVVRVRGGSSDAKGWTVVYPFPHSIVVVGEKIDGDDCEDALKKVSGPEAWLSQAMHGEDSRMGKDACSIAIEERVRLPEALDFALRTGTHTEDESEILLDEIKRDPTLAAHALARLAPRPVVPPLGEYDSLSMVKILDAIPDETAKRDLVKKSLAECQEVDRIAECTAMRLQAYSYWALVNKDKAACDAATFVVKALATKATPNGEGRALEILYRVGTCGTEKTLRDALLASLDPKMAEGEKLSTSCDFEELCAADAGKVDLGNRESCASLPGKAALWLAGHCDAAIITRAKSIVASKPDPMVEKAAKCVLARCEKKDGTSPPTK